MTHSPTPRGSPPAVPRFTSRVPLLGVSAAALLAAGCGSDAPTEPAAPAAILAPAEAPVAAATSATAEPSMSPQAIVALGIDDANTRLLPALSDATTAAQLRRLLGELAGQLAAGDAARAKRSLGRARDAIRGGDESDAADLAAIDLVLDRAEALLESTENPAL